MTEAAADAPIQPSQVKVIAASSLGTIFEWYDFYLYGLLATVITAQFFSGVNATTGFILALAAFAAGFAVRPFGALVFGRIANPAANAASARMKPVVSLTPEKNCAVMTVASRP